jgi:hypothetical protein
LTRPGGVDPQIGQMFRPGISHTENPGRVSDRGFRTERLRPDQ